MSEDFESDINDLHGGFSWADAWVTVFFVFESLVLMTSLLFYLCLLRVMAKNSQKEASINYLFLLFFFVTFLVDVGLVLEQFLSNFGHQWHSTSTCQFVTFVTLGNRLLQAFGVLSLLYLTLTMMLLKSKKIENLARTLMHPRSGPRCFGAHFCSASSHEYSRFGAWWLLPLH